MFADPAKVGLRRLKRRVKAGVSLLVAVAAGAFLTLSRGGAEAQSHRSPSGPDARDGGVSGDAAATDAGTTVATDAGAIVRHRDAGRPAPQIDRHEHRTGMPVRDNLLE